MIIFVDVDSVVADLEPAWLARYNRDYNDTLKPEDLRGWDMTGKVKPECGAKIYDYLEDPSLYDEVQPVQGALEGVKTLREWGHRVVFATSSPNGSAGRKLRWLIDHEFLKPAPKGSAHSDYIEVHSKGLLMGDILIDDGPHNVQSFLGRAILLRRPHNRDFVWPGLNTAADWTDVLNLIWNGEA